MPKSAYFGIKKLFFLHISEKSTTFAAEMQQINISDSLVIH